MHGNAIHPIQGKQGKHRNISAPLRLAMPLKMFPIVVILAKQIF